MMVGMATSVNPPRGMRDFLPSEKARRERVLAVIRDRYAAHGFDEIETPVMEDSSRLHAGLGGDNEKLAFGVLKRALTTDDLRAAESALDLADLGLRFDLTVPLARFYASHRAELPGVFRSVQIAPVWRAERPQKGRYRQFVQCDIDIIGEATALAEVELIAATLDTLAALGLEGCTIRINDRRLLLGMLEVFGFAASEHDGVLITLDKLDKLGVEGVVAELRERGYTTAGVDASEAFLTRPTTKEFLPFGEAAIRKALPAGVPEEAVLGLAAIGDALGASESIVFDPFLVRGMGYYTGTIFEIHHPDFSFSLGGGGRYDGMIGRFLGTDVPAAGFSIGFERIVDLVSLPAADAADAVALLHDGAPLPQLAALKAALVAEGRRVRLERKPKKVAPLLDALAADGFGAFAFVREDTTPESLELKPLG
jgi:histidyl-tRNA synthetase